MASVLRGHKDLVIDLLAAGADFTIGEKDGYTPMHGAGFQGRAEIAAVLLKHGVPATSYHADGYAPIHRAAWGTERRHADTIRVLVEEGGVDIDLPVRSPAPAGTTVRSIVERSRSNVMAATVKDLIERKIKTAAAAAAHNKPKTEL